MKDRRAPDRLASATPGTIEPPTRASGVTARGRVVLWQGGSLWIGRGGGRVQWHAHHAHQITLPFASTCRFRSDENGDWREFRSAFVVSDRPHQLELQHEGIAQLFVEPETAEGRALARRFGDADITELPEPLRAEATTMLQSAYGSGLRDAELVTTARSAVALLAAAPIVVPGLDARVARALDFIRSRIRGPIALADAAAAAALSPGRFRHLFVQETGAAFRTYVLWSRLNVAIERSMAGDSWTEAAHEAGFADSAHLTRTFKRMFGINPATLVRDPDEPGDRA